MRMPQPPLWREGNTIWITYIYAWFLIIWICLWASKATTNSESESVWSRSRSPTKIYRIRNQRWNPVIKWKLQIRSYPWIMRHITYTYWHLIQPWQTTTRNPASCSHSRRKPGGNSAGRRWHCSQFPPAETLIRIPARCMWSILTHPPYAPFYEQCPWIRWATPTISVDTQTPSPSSRPNVQSPYHSSTPDPHRLGTPDPCYSVQTPTQCAIPNSNRITNNLARLQAHRQSHPCLWETMRQLGWDWPLADIGQLWQKKPNWFTEKGTCLAVARKLLQSSNVMIALAPYNTAPPISVGTVAQAAKRVITRSHATGGPTRTRSAKTTSALSLQRYPQSKRISMQNMNTQTPFLDLWTHRLSTGYQTLLS